MEKREVRVGDQVRYLDITENLGIAFVTFKHSSLYVNLFVIDPNGTSYGRTSVSIGEEPNTWRFA